MTFVAQGGLPASGATQGFAQQLLDRLPGKSGSNGRAPVAPPSQRTQDAAARAMLRQNAQYDLLLDDQDEDDEAAAHLAAPTTAAVPKKKEKKIRMDRAGQLKLCTLYGCVGLHRCTVLLCIGAVAAKQHINCSQPSLQLCWKWQLQSVLACCSTH